MIYQKTGETFTTEGKTFAVGGEVFANGSSDYGGLFGTVTEIRTGADRETDNDTPDIHCEFRPPESSGMIHDIENRFSDLYGQPKQLDELALDFVIMAPDMLEPIPALLPEAAGKTYTLTYYRDDDDSCDIGALAVSSDMGTLLRKMYDHLESCKTKVILSHVEQTEGCCVFAYEAEETGVEGLYLGYTISETPVLPSMAEDALDKP